MNYSKTVMYKNRIQPVEETYSAIRDGDTEIHTIVRKYENSTPEIKHILQRKYVKPETIKETCTLCDKRAERNIIICDVKIGYCHKHGIETLRGLIIYKSAQDLWNKETKLHAKEKT